MRRKVSRLMDEYFPGWELTEVDGKSYVRFEEVGKEHLAKVQESPSGKYIRYMDDRYYLGR